MTALTIDRTPTRLSSGTAVCAALITLAAGSLCSWPALAAGTLGPGLVVVGLARGSIAPVTTGACCLFVAAIVASVQRVPSSRSNSLREPPSATASTESTSAGNRRRTRLLAAGRCSARAGARVVALARQSVVGAVTSSGTSAIAVSFLRASTQASAVRTSR